MAPALVRGTGWRRALPVLAGLSWACGGEGANALRGHVTVDGSSTAYPIAEAVSEEFQLLNPRVMVTVGHSGTGGGLERFCRGETDVATASRPIQEAEVLRCRANGVAYLELPVAQDGLSIVVNPANAFLDCVTVEELRRIWRAGSPVRTWRDVRPELPAEPIRLYGPGTGSGTFDIFTESVIGTVGASRTDYQASEDDNLLVQGVMGDHFALAYFGYAYLEENREGLKVLAVDGGEGCVVPSRETIRNGSYSPLSRELYLYVSRSSLQRRGMGAFMDFFMSNAASLIPPTGLMPLMDSVYDENRKALDAARDPAASPSQPEGGAVSPDA